MFIASSTVPILDGYVPVVSRFIRTGLGLSAAPIQTGKLNALNLMVKELQRFLLFDKFTAFYPILGGIASWHSLNLINPTTFQITWTGTVTHNANGVTSDGTTGYGDTGFIRTTVAASYGYFTTSTAYNGTPMGTTDTDSAVASDFTDRNGNALSAEFNDNGVDPATTAAPPTSGLIVGQSLSNSTNEIWVRGSLIDSGSGSGNATTNLPVSILGLNTAGGGVADFCTQTFQLFFIAATSLSSTEHSMLNYIVNQYQTSLARGV